MITRTAARTGGFGRAPWVLSLLLLVTATIASVSALAMPELINGPAVMVGSMRGTALVLLALAIPMLVLAMATVRRGGPLPVVGWIAGLVFITYQAWMFLFAVPFNGLFLVYVAMLGTGFWGIVALLATLGADRFTGPAGPRMHVRLLAGWMVLSCVAFYALWLRNVVPALVASEAPALLEGSGMVTPTNYVLDMAFFLPFTILVAATLWRRTPWGVVVGGAMLVVLVLESIAIAVDQWVGAAADPSSPLASAAMTPMFGVVAAIGVLMIGLWYRGARAPEPAGLELDITLRLAPPRR